MSRPRADDYYPEPEDFRFLWWLCGLGRAEARAALRRDGVGAPAGGLRALDWLEAQCSLDVVTKCSLGPSSPLPPENDEHEVDAYVTIEAAAAQPNAPGRRAIERRVQRGSIRHRVLDNVTDRSRPRILVHRDDVARRKQ